MSDLIYMDDNLTTAQAVNAPSFESPFPRDAKAYILKQDFWQLAASFVPLALNTAHPDFGTFLLANESPRSDMGGGVVKWTRTYAKKPDTRSEPGNVTYNRIGYAPSSTTIIASFRAPLTLGGNLLYVYDGRSRESKVLAARIQFDYFNVPMDYATLDLVPIVQEFKYYWQFQTVPTEFLWDAGQAGATIGTTPTLSTYKAMVGANIEIVAQASQLRQWLGNFVERQTVYILAP